MSSLLLYDDGTMVQEYFMTIASLIACQVPSSMVVLDTPDAAAAAGEDDDDDDDDDVYEPFEAVEDRSIMSMELPTLHNYVLVQDILLKRQL